MGLDPLLKRKLEIRTIPRWLLFTLGTSTLPIIIRSIILFLAGQQIQWSEMRPELFFLTVVCQVDTIKNWRHMPTVVMVFTFLLIITSVVYCMALSASLNLLTMDLYKDFDYIMGGLVIIGVLFDFISVISGSD